MKHFIVIASACALFATAVPAAAAPIGLTLVNSPDITSGFIDISYNTASGLLQADGFALEMFDDTNGINAINNGLFNLDATIDGSGTLINGTLTITGEVVGFGSANPLLTADLTDFGFQDAPGGELFEFMFTVTGGDLATPAFFGNLGDGTGGLILSIGDPNAFDGTFDTDFNNNFGIPGFGSGVSDVGLVPEPGTLALMLVSGLFVRRRRRRTSGR